jgi:NAD(P)-dependent dehydrogenase (short-subunit alcohol dehydrogenase family)
MVADGTKGKIVFVSSVLGLMSIVGYSSYSPAKHALRGSVAPMLPKLSLRAMNDPGLAETLRSEMLLYGIDVHILFPGTIYSPGYTEENKTKPKITMKIEETDEGLKPEQVAQALLNGKVRLSSPLDCHSTGTQAYKTGTSTCPSTPSRTSSGPQREARRHSTTTSSTASTSLLEMCARMPSR